MPATHNTSDACYLCMSQSLTKYRVRVKPQTATNTTISPQWGGHRRGPSCLARGAVVYSGCRCVLARRRV